MQNPFSRTKSLEEAQEEDERLSSELSIAQKKAAIRKLKAAGLTGKSFGWDWKAIRAWLKAR